MTDSSDSNPACTVSALMPLYLVAIGGIFKMVVRYVLLRYEANKVGAAIRERRVVTARPLEEEVTSAFNLNMPLGPTGVIIENDRDTEDCCTRLKELAVIMLEFYSIFSINIQLIFDIGIVMNSNTSAGWPRYQCYAETFLNSPNISSLFVFLEYERMRWLFLFGFSTLTSEKMRNVAHFRRCFVALVTFCYLPPYISHALPAIIIYVWIVILETVVVRCILWLVMRLNKEEYSNNWTHPVHEALSPEIRQENTETDDVVRGRMRYLEKLIVQSLLLGGLLPAWTALSASTMVRWYANPDDYIGSLWQSMNDRHTMAFLDKEGEVIHEKAANWFSYIHYFA